MTQQWNPEAPGAGMRLIGSLARIDRMGSAVDGVDAAYRAVGGRLAAYAVREGVEPARAARQLVTAGVVSPDDTRAVAMQEAPDRGLVDRIKTDPARAAADISGMIEAQPISGAPWMTMNGFRKVLARDAHKVTPEMLAGVFERVSEGCHATGATEGARIAEGAFVAATQAAVERTRERAVVRPRIQDER